VLAVFFLALAPGIDAYIRSNNRYFLLFLIPLLIDAIYLLSARFISGPVVNDFHDHANVNAISLFGLLGLPALAIFAFRARGNIWAALWPTLVGLVVWFVIFMYGLNIVTDGRAVI